MRSLRDLMPVLGFHRSLRHAEYEEWLKDLQAEAELYDYELVVDGAHAEFHREPGNVIDEFEFESILDHPAR